MDNYCWLRWISIVGCNGISIVGCDGIGIVGCDGISIVGSVPFSLFAWRIFRVPAELPHAAAQRCAVAEKGDDITPVRSVASES